VEDAGLAVNQSLVNVEGKETIVSFDMVKGEKEKN
jgi:hypothetical protein